MKQKISIEYKYRGSVELPQNSEAKNVFFRTKQAYANHEKMSVSLLFSKSKLRRLQKYNRGSATEELENLNLYIEMGKILGFNYDDANIFLAANPDSLYLKKSEWEANLYDYGKTLNSFNFIKCDHGKNVADDILLKQFSDAHIKNANVFILTFDRELKERFTEVTHQSNNLYILGK